MHACAEHAGRPIIANGMFETIVRGKYVMAQHDSLPTNCALLVGGYRGSGEFAARMSPLRQFLRYRRFHA
eukprot:2668510-Alexandrium_andersonii.AAC.1